jgi:hypothetical protein
LVSREPEKRNMRLNETISGSSALSFVVSPVVSGQLAGLDALCQLCRCSEQGR